MLNSLHFSLQKMSPSTLQNSPYVSSFCAELNKAIHVSKVKYIAEGLYAQSLNIFTPISSLMAFFYGSGWNWWNKEVKR